MYTSPFIFRCVSCTKEYDGSLIRYRCDCGEILDIDYHDGQARSTSVKRKAFDQRLTDWSIPNRSGVWRYRELLPPIPPQYIVSKPEGNTNLYPAGRTRTDGYAAIGTYAGIDELYLKHEGENPTGSFKDRGMTVGVSAAKMLSARAVACASTGNTSASLAGYAAKGQLPCFIFLPNAHISVSKLMQAVGYGATVLAVDGDFDDCMRLVESVCIAHGVYLLNSINPFRIEGQKTIAFELFHQVSWNPPDWIVLPGGNLGNTAAIGKAVKELHTIGIIARLPRIAVIQAAGANPFFQSYRKKFAKRISIKADTCATAIRIGNPVSYERARRVIEETDGVVAQVTDQELLDAKAIIDRAGIGCEPASATTVAGVKKLVAQHIIQSSDRVACILTGHMLKDPDTTMKYHAGELDGIHSHYANQVISVTQKTVEKTIDTLLKQK